MSLSNFLTLTGKGLKSQTQDFAAASKLFVDCAHAHQSLMIVMFCADESKEKKVACQFDQQLVASSWAWIWSPYGVVYGVRSYSYVYMRDIMFNQRV